MLGSAETVTKGDRMNDKDTCNFSTEREIEGEGGAPAH